MSLFQGMVMTGDYNASSNTCDSCGRTYFWPSAYIRHKRYECGVTPQFPCPYCDYKAKQNANLIRHIKRKHSNVMFSADKNKLK